MEAPPKLLLKLLLKLAPKACSVTCSGLLPILLLLSRWKADDTFLGNWNLQTGRGGCSVSGELQRGSFFDLCRVWVRLSRQISSSWRGKERMWTFLHISFNFPHNHYRQSWRLKSGKWVSYSQEKRIKLFFLQSLLCGLWQIPRHSPFTFSYLCVTFSSWLK